MPKIDPSISSSRLKLFTMIAGLCCVFLFQNCTKSFEASSTSSNVDITNASSIGSFGAPTATPAPSITISNEANYGVNQVISTFKPALAIRASSCIMCHANITGNVITDLGYGNSYYFGGGTTDSTDWYTPDVLNGNWLNTSWVGNSSLYVPKTPSVLYGNMSLAQAMTSLTQGTVPVTEAASIYIGSPTSARIRQVGNFAAGQLISYTPNSSRSPALSGLTAMGSGTYFGNGTNMVVCDGDVVIDGVVWLQNLKLATINGCRIYSTHSIFISGQITYSTTIDSELQNLQLASGVMVAMGIGHGCGDSYTYLNGTNASMTETKYTRARTPDELEAAMTADADVLGSGLMDAGCEPAGQNVSEPHLLINAPVFFDRYTGDLLGSIIAELTFSARGTQSNFSYDPIFSNVPTLPLLNPSEYLSVGN